MKKFYNLGPGLFYAPIQVDNTIKISVDAYLFSDIKFL